MADKKILNLEQIAAISHGQGPLLIIAGAGTGKTTVVSERIKYLLENGVNPEEILALTFTEKAAFEMEERIDKILPYGYSRLWISTFHSFCDQILRAEGIHFGINPNFRLMNESDSVMFLKKNIFKLRLDYFRPLGNPTKFLEEILQHFARLSDEDITPKEYLAYARSLEDSHEKNISKEKKEEIKQTLELAVAFEFYDQLKTKEGVADFSNLLSLTLKLFRTRPNILKKYRSQFKYILVDEFQDTNYAQNELAILLAGETKNITVVADDDQAIYRWRGAALSNVIQFRNNFQNSTVYTLTKNYRSTQEILDKSYQLIQNNNPNRLEIIENIDKKLTSQRKIKGEKIEFIQANRVDEEAEAIAKKIITLIKKKNFAYSDIAILVRANNHASPITQALSRLKVPYQFLGPGQLFHQEEIKDLIAYLKVLYSLEDTVSLYRVLNMDVFQLSSRDLSYLLSFSKKRSLTLFEALEKADETNVSDETKEKVKKITSMILRHLDRVKNDTAGQILYYFLTDTGLFRRFLDFKTPQEEQIAQNVAVLFDRLKTYETINRDTNIYTSVEWIDLMMEMGDSPLISETNWKQTNAVNILTVHASKGLEFPVVFIVNLVSDRFPTRERSEKIPIPQNLIKEILPKGDYHLQEERRLFYVAMTRARDLLFLTASKFYAEGKREKKFSPFVFEVLPEAAKQQKMIESLPTQLSLIDITRSYENSLNDTKPNTFPKLKLSWVSYSQLQSFDLCPLHFKARYILNIPTPSASSLSFGISIHNTLKDFYTLLDDKIPNLDDFLLLLKKSWISEGYQEKTHEQYSYKRAENLIRNYFSKYFDPDNKPLAIEMPFSFYINSDLKVLGKIDRIDVTNQGIEIIDYKTGSAETAYKSAYKFQLGLYALAATKVRNDIFQKNPDNVKVTLFYIESGEKITSKVTDDELRQTEQKILEKVFAIEQSDFKCNKSMFCSNCEYKMLCNSNT